MLWNAKCKNLWIWWSVSTKLVHCTEVIEQDKVTDNSKVYYRRATAHIALHNEHEALADIEQCLKLDDTAATKRACDALRAKLKNASQERDTELSKKLQNAFIWDNIKIVIDNNRHAN